MSQPLTPHPNAEAFSRWAARTRSSRRRGVGRIVLLYAGFATAWILFSDRAASVLLRDPARFLLVTSIKGVAFILVSAILLFITLDRYLRGLATSEQKFTHIFHMSPDAIDLTHLESGILVELNPSYVTMFGYPREQLIGRSTLPEDLGIWVRTGDRQAHIARLLAQGIVLGHEATLRRRDGSTFIAEICSSLVEVDGERFNLSMARDISAQKQAEEDLRESSRRLELATGAAHLGVWDRHLVDGTDLWNERMFEIYGIPRDASVPLYPVWLNERVHPEDRAALEAAAQKALAGDQDFELAFRCLHPDGGVRHLKSVGHLLRDPSGKPMRLIGITQDLTREVEALADQRRLQVELQHAEKLESIGSLAGGVAHDMNNVLAAIMGMASAMRATCPPGDPQSTPLETITRACARGRDVVKSLLYFARKDLESVGPVNLNLIAREMVHLLSYTTLQRVQIVTDFQEPLALIEGDSGALSHALINLCVNAVDAMPQGGTLWLTTRSAPDQGVTLSVRDSGEGMSPDVIRRAVEPFFTTKPLGKGTGLGLAMVYGTVKAHKGSFEIQSVPGQGSEILLGFPMHSSAPPEAGLALPPPAPPPTVGPLRILLVDDDELIRMSVGPMLGELGHEVCTAESGLDALQRLAAGLRVDLVILDMNMPGLNGAQTLSRLLELRPGQTVLMATGYSDESIAPYMQGRPSVFSLRKPFSMKEFRNKLGTIGSFSGR